MKKVILLIATILIMSSGSVYSQKRAMTPEDLWSFGRLSEVQLSPDKTKVLYGVTYYDVKTNKSTSDLYLVNVSGGEPVNLTKTPDASESNGVFHPTNGKIYFLSSVNDEMQIFSISMKGSERKQVSNIKGGVNGFIISPDGNNVMYIQDVKIDTTPSEIYPDLPNVNVRIIDNLMYRHWNEWSNYTYSHPFITSIDKKGNIPAGKDIMPGERYDTPIKPFGGLEQINWSYDGKKLAYACKKQIGKEYALSTNSDIYVYDLSSGKTEDISTFNLGYDHDPVFSPDGKYIAWKSMKTPGFESDRERIMLYSTSNKSVVELTEGFDQSCAHYAWNDKSNVIYFISGIHATFQLYCIDINTKKIKQITQGVHDYVEYAVGDNFLVGAMQSMSAPTDLFIVDVASGKETQLTNINKKLLDEIEFGKVEGRWIKTVDNKDMLVWIIYPPFFDKNKQYPGVLYCEGGPQSAVSQFWSYRWNFQMMAAGGYVIMAPNRRGLPTFGQEWNDQISGDYGGLNQKDYLQTVDVISKEPFIDANRLGAVGASYGGYSVFWLAGNHQKRFKAFIAHCGIYDFYSMYGSTEEYFFVNHEYEGPYWQVPEPKSYNFSPHLAVANWDTPIMIITGGNDFRIPYTQSLEAFDAAQLRGIPSKLLFFPDECHFVLKPQNAILWQREFRNWLDKYLK